MKKQYGEELLSTKEKREKTKVLKWGKMMPGDDWAWQGTSFGFFFRQTPSESNWKFSPRKDHTENIKKKEKKRGVKTPSSGIMQGASKTKTHKRKIPGNWTVLAPQMQRPIRNLELKKVYKWLHWANMFGTDVNLLYTAAKPATVSK